jgi:hypothetical protein
MALTRTVTFGLLRSVIPQGKSIAPRQSAQHRRRAAPPDRLSACGAARTGFPIAHCDMMRPIAGLLAALEGVTILLAVAGTPRRRVDTRRPSPVVGAAWSRFRPHAGPLVQVRVRKRAPQTVCMPWVAIEGSTR